jgi:hypothetical protein
MFYDDAALTAAQPLDAVAIFAAAGVQYDGR